MTEKKLERIVLSLIPSSVDVHVHISKTASWPETHSTLWVFQRRSLSAGPPPRDYTDLGSICVLLHRFKSGHGASYMLSSDGIACTGSNRIMMPPSNVIVTRVCQGHRRRRRALIHNAVEECRDACKGLQHLET